MLKVIGKKEEQLQKLREQQVHMQTTMGQLQGDAKEGQALRAADKAAKAYAADLQAKVLLICALDAAVYVCDGDSQCFFQINWL